MDARRLSRKAPASALRLSQGERAAATKAFRGAETEVRQSDAQRNQLRGRRSLRVLIDCWNIRSQLLRGAVTERGEVGEMGRIAGADGVAGIGGARNNGNNLGGRTRLEAGGYFPASGVVWRRGVVAAIGAIWGKCRRAELRRAASGADGRKQNEASQKSGENPRGEAVAFASDVHTGSSKLRRFSETVKDFDARENRRVKGFCAGRTSILRT
jgi:hypothetical protein